MAEINRLQILVYGEELEYKSAEDLGLSFQRIADDEVDLSRKYGEFSYTFDIPITKTNSRIFQQANANGRKNIFNPNRDLPCQVYNNSQLLLDGIISLQGVTSTDFSCIFYSKLKEFADLIEEKSLKDLQFPVINWQYETSIIAHINADYKDATETYWQFPLTYYGSWFTPYDTYKNKQDFRGINLDIEAYTYQRFYYLLNTPAGNTPAHRYHHEFPPAFYISSLVNQIFEDAGWSLGGQFFNQPDVLKQVLLYAGDDDNWDRAVAASAEWYDETGGIISTKNMTTPLFPAKLLPDMLQSDFLNGIMNMYNLYPVVDVVNKSIKLETYTTLFGDVFQPYDITKKVKKETAKFVYMENNNPSIYFAEAENFRVMGDNAASTGVTTQTTNIYWRTVKDSNIDALFNHRGTTSEIELPFSPPTVKKTYVWNDYNIAGTSMSAGSHVIIHPIMSSETPRDTEKWAKNSGQTYVFNDEGRLKFNGSPTIHYYYGKSNATTIDKTGKGAASNYYYLNFYGTSGTTLTRLPITFCSPMQIQTYRDLINAQQASPADIDDLDNLTCTYLKATYNCIGSGVTTNYSLTFSESDYHNTLWTVFHKPKYDRFMYSEVLEAEMRMNEYDWQEMQLERPIKYNGEVYHIVEITGYNPIKNIASIRLIKTL
jgi:hypothetical protein